MSAVYDAGGAGAHTGGVDTTQRSVQSCPSVHEYSAVLGVKTITKNHI
jgi:hypothetical protein